MLQILRKDVSASAKINRHGSTSSLVASFYASEPPVTWHCDLREVETFKLFLQENTGSWDLGYEAAGAPFKTIAHFKDRGEAKESYETVQSALESGGLTVGRFILRLFVTLFLAFIFINIVVAIMAVPDKAATQKMMMEQMSQFEKQMPQMQVPTQNKTGVPVSADDLLAPRQ